MSTTRVRTFLVALLALGAGGLAACSDDSPSAAEAAGPGTVATSEASVVIIDVRTTAEWEAGHLDGALHISLEEPGFAEKIAALDPDGTYQLYCRSGNRAGIAAEQMLAAGFDDVTNLGSLEQAAAATGLDILT